MSRLPDDSSDPRETAGLLLELAPRLLAEGQGQLLAGGLAKLPAFMRVEMPWLAYWQGACALPFAPEEAFSCFRQAFRGFLGRRAEAEDESGLLLAWSGAVGAIVLDRNNAARLDPWVAWLDRRQARNDSFPSPAVESQVVNSMLGAILLRQLRHPLSRQWLTRADLLALETGGEAHGIHLLVHLVCFYLMAEKIARGVHLLQVLERQIAGNVSVPPLVRVGWCLLKALEAHWVTGDDEEAGRWADQGLAVAEETGVHAYDFALHCQGVHGGLTMNDPETTRRRLQAVEALLPGSGPWHRSYYHFLAGWLELCRNKQDEAREHLRSALTLAEKSGATIPRAFSHAGMAQLLLEVGEPDAAERHFAQARAILPAEDDHFAFMYLIFAVQLALQKGKETEALNLLKRAFKIGRRHGCINLLTWRRPVMALLCGKAMAAGIETQYARKLIRRHRLPFPAVDPPEWSRENWPYPLKILTLGRFTVCRDGKPLPLTGRGQKKPLEMLKALVALGGQGVTGASLAESLWPDSDGDAAYSALTTTLSRLRRWLGCDAAIRVRAGAVSLDEDNCWVDAEDFEILADQCDQEAASFGRRRNRQGPALAALALYRGNFLPADLNCPWSISRRERLKGKFLRLVTRTGAALEAGGKWDGAMEWYLRALEIDDHCEEFYQRLMHCYLHLGRLAEAKGVYARCRKTLAAGAGVRPSPATEALFRSLQQS